jgi:hypothetical protein
LGFILEGIEGGDGGREGRGRVRVRN